MKLIKTTKQMENKTPTERNEKKTKKKNKTKTIQHKNKSQKTMWREYETNLIYPMNKKSQVVYSVNMKRWLTHTHTHTKEAQLFKKKQPSNVDVWKAQNYLEYLYTTTYGIQSCFLYVLREWDEDMANAQSN